MSPEDAAQLAAPGVAIEDHTGPGRMLSPVCGRIRRAGDPLGIAWERGPLGLVPEDVPLADLARRIASGAWSVSKD